MRAKFLLAVVPVLVLAMLLLVLPGHAQDDPIATPTPQPTPFGGGTGEIAILTSDTIHIIPVSNPYTPSAETYHWSASVDLWSRFSWSPDGSRAVAVNADRELIELRIAWRDYPELCERCPLSPLSWGRFSYDRDWGQYFYSPVYSPDGMRIAYSDSSAIYVMDTNVQSALRIVPENYQPNSGIYYAGMWSPDGRYFLYNYEESAPHTRICIIDLASNETECYGGGWRVPEWSPDSQHVLFYAMGYAPDGDLDNNLAVLDVSSGEMRQLTESFGIGCAHWSPDGRRILFCMRDEADVNLYTLYTVDVATGIIQQVTNHYAGQSDYNPSWSPDGRWIAFVRSTPERGSQVLLLQDGMDMIAPLTNYFPDSVDVLWRPQQPVFAGLPASTDGSPQPHYQLTYVHDLSDMGGWTIYSLDLQEVMPAPHLPIYNRSETGYVHYFARSPAWSPDGSHLAFAGYPDNRLGFGLEHIFIINADGSELRQLTPERGDQPSWSPNGTQLAYQTYVDGYAQIFTTRADEFTPVQITSGESSHSYPAWSPTGDEIAYTEETRGNPRRIIIIDADGSNPRPFPAADMSAAIPSWSPDGRWLTFLGEGDSVQGVYAVDYLADPLGEHPIMFAPGGVLSAWSPDGLWLAYSHSLTHTIHIASTACLQQPETCPVTESVQIPHNGAASDAYPTWRIIE
ncbi:MAG: PD40 domain-containing protein [Anaerolineae bacterium]|nr:PD40 domain-containing protein [Anaerolineae bacterium]